MKNSFRDGSLRPAIGSFFNSEIDTSRSLLRSHLQLCPEDPLAYAITAAVEFYDTATTWLLAGGGVSPGSFLRGQHMQMDSTRREIITESLDYAERFAETPSLADDDCADMGIFSRALASSIRRDYTAVVLNQWPASLAHARDANLLGRKLLKTNPKAHDAYCIFGWTEYLISRVPSAMRPFARIPGITGNRRKAIQCCLVASHTGVYCRELAKCLLIALYTEEGEPDKAVQTLCSLAVDFPMNLAMAAELKKRQQDLSESRVHYGKQ